MEKKKWRLGERCYVVDVDLNAKPARHRILRAQVVHVHGRGGRGMSHCPERFGPQFFEGEPFATMREARDHARRLLRASLGTAAARRRIPLLGAATAFPVPQDWPEVGDIIYGIDEEASEVFEAPVGIVNLCEGVGYDESPGNPEASNIRIRERWLSKKEALAAAQERYGRRFAFISKETLAARTNDRIESVWTDARKRIEDPAWQAATFAGLKMLIESANDRSRQ